MAEEDQWLTRKLCQDLAEVRLREARHLLDSGFASGAYYIAGYAVELALKAVISKAFLSEAIPPFRFVQDIRSHNLTKLVNVAGLSAELKIQRDASERFAANWLLVEQWSEQSRYLLKNAEDAQYLIEAIEHPTEGVLAWIRNRW